MKDIITLIIAILGLLVSIVNLIYIIFRYNLNIELVKRIFKINEEYNKKIKMNFKKYYSTKNLYEKLIIINKGNIYFEEYIYKIRTVLSNFGINKLKCENCDKKFKLKWKNETYFDIELSYKLNILLFYTIITINKKIIVNLLVNNFELRRSLNYPTYLLSNFNFKINLLPFKKKIFFHFVLNV